MKTERKSGSGKGKIWIASDFDAESEKINKMFYGENYKEALSSFDFAQDDKLD